jgi:hypothetical protein
MDNFPERGRPTDKTPSLNDDRVFQQVNESKMEPFDAVVPRTRTRLFKRKFLERGDDVLTTSSPRSKLPSFIPENQLVVQCGTCTFCYFVLVTSTT